MKKLSFNILDVAKLDIEEGGAFVRSFLHERRGDPHASFHWMPRPGKDENTPHLTRRREERTWLPTFKNDCLWRFFAEFEALAVERFIAGLCPIDLVRAEIAGWRFSAPLPTAILEECVRETGPGEVEMRVSYDTIFEAAQHLLFASERPTSYADRRPNAPLPMLAAVRWVDGEIVAFAEVGLFEHGVRDPKTGDELGSPGWYWLPRLDYRSLLLDILGEDGRAGLKEAARLAMTFFGPIVGSSESESRELDARLQDLLAGARRR